MPIELIKEDERLVFKFQDTEIYYRRIAGHMQRKWLRECTNKRGILDSAKVGKLAMDYATLDWKGFVRDGKPIIYSSSELDNLPGIVIEKYVDVLLDGIDNTKQEEAEKNS